MLVPEALLAEDRYISPLMAVRRTRLLSGAGTITVSFNSHVTPNDTIGEVQSLGGVRVLDAAKLLGVAPDQVTEYLLIPDGAQVEEGELLAKRGRFRSRTLTAPISGLVTLLERQGYLLIRGAPQREPVLAMMRGQVIQVMQGEGVVIEGGGALVQGVWGNGQEHYGLLRMMVKKPDEVVSPNLITVGLRGTILIAGASITREALEKAETAQIRGLVLGGLDASLLALAKQMSYPILLTEGFGHHPIEERTFKILKTLDGRDGILTCRHIVRHGRTRPELFVPRTGQTGPLLIPTPFGAQDRVRVLSTPYFGKRGTVVSNKGLRHTLPNNMNVTVCEVRLDNDEIISVPYSNLERILE